MTLFGFLSNYYHLAIEDVNMSETNSCKVKMLNVSINLPYWNAMETQYEDVEALVGV